MVKFYVEKIRTGAINQLGEKWVLEFVPIPWRAKVAIELEG